MVDWNHFKLSKEQVEQFWRDGFLESIPILTTEQCDLLLNEYQYYTVCEYGFMLTI